VAEEAARIEAEEAEQAHQGMPLTQEGAEVLGDSEKVGPFPEAGGGQKPS
jgi:hypothetical protein